jgi:hypothetical protein
MRNPCEGDLFLGEKLLTPELIESQNSVTIPDMEIEAAGTLEPTLGFLETASVVWLIPCGVQAELNRLIGLEPRPLFSRPFPTRRLERSPLQGTLTANTTGAGYWRRLKVSWWFTMWTTGTVTLLSRGVCWPYLRTCAGSQPPPSGSGWRDRVWRTT